uniref:Golgin A7 family member B n=1 Tax=Crocodylus porosus TaxID=8502 RepID=A0A7M4F634_CROPO
SPLRRSASLATKVFVQRDYSDGTMCQFQTKFPPELDSRIERQLFEETVKTLNNYYAEAEKIGGSSYLEGCLACATAYFIFLCMETHYEKVGLPGAGQGARGQPGPGVPGRRAAAGCARAGPAPSGDGRREGRGGGTGRTAEAALAPGVKVHRREGREQGPAGARGGGPGGARPRAGSPPRGSPRERPLELQEGRERERREVSGTARPGAEGLLWGIFPPCRDSPTQAVPSSLGSKPRPQRRLLRHRYPP